MQEMEKQKELDDMMVDEIDLGDGKINMDDLMN